VAPLRNRNWASVPNSPAIEFIDVTNVPPGSTLFRFSLPTELSKILGVGKLPFHPPIGSWTGF